VALQVLMVAIPWIFINSINMYLLYATDRQKQATNMVLISCGVNILLNFLFIPKFSYLGASWATVITEALNALLFFGFIFFALNLKINIFKILPKPLVASLLMGVLIYKLYDLNLILLISLSVIVYIGLLVFLRTFDDQDKYILSKMLPFASKYIKN
jgi:O-antigen/teichoic acid export membrane protein